MSGPAPGLFHGRVGPPLDPPLDCDGINHHDPTRVDYQPVKPASAPLDPIMRYFAHAHLPDRLAAISRPFCDLAEQMLSILPRNAERTVMLRKLLEAKDAAVRAALPE